MDQTHINTVRTYLLKLTALIALYVIGGAIGLTLAVPPGYATIIWPASGLAIGMLILHGWRLWPGILIGSFLVNCYVADVFVLSDTWLLKKMLTAFGIAAGSTIQALIGYLFVKKFIGIPLVLDKAKQMPAMPP